MATYDDLFEAYLESPIGSGNLMDAQNAVFMHLTANINAVSYWPTRATPALFANAVQRYLQEHQDVTSKN